MISPIPFALREFGMPRIRLKTKLVLSITGMVFALVVAFSYLYVSHVVRQRTGEAYDSAAFVAKQVRDAARDASQIDLSATFASSNPPMPSTKC